MQNPLLYLLRPALIPELRADVAAGASCNVKGVLISVAAVRTFPYKLAVIFYYLYLTVKTTLLTVVALGVKLRIHDVVYGNKGITKIQRFKTPMARNPEH